MTKRGFTLTELMVVLGIMAALLSLVTINLLKPQVTTSTTGAVNSLVADLRQQQIKAMMGEGAPGVASASGVFFDSTSYTLFSGDSYSPNDVNNYRVDLATNMEFSDVTLPGSSVIFALLSGEIVGFTQGATSVKIGHDASADKKTVELNKYGVVIDAQ